MYMYCLTILSNVIFFQTRMQSLVPDPKADYRSVLDAFNTIIRHEGMMRTMKGAPIVVLGAGPAHAFYFACYEFLKKNLSGGKQGNHLAHGRSAVGSPAWSVYPREKYQALWYRKIRLHMVEIMPHMVAVAFVVYIY